MARGFGNYANPQIPPPGPKICYNTPKPAAIRTRRLFSQTEP